MKVGLKETLTLISKGYTKKEIEALADIDAADEQEAKEEASAEETKEEETSEPETEEVDYKKLYEELKQKGYMVIPGRVSRHYFNERFYGIDVEEGGNE